MQKANLEQCEEIQYLETRWLNIDRICLPNISQEKYYIICVWHLSFVVVVIVCQLYLLLPMQSVHIAIDIESSIPYHSKVYSICDKVCQWFAAGLGSSLCTPVVFTNNTHLQNRAEMLLKVALSTIILGQNISIPSITQHTLRYFFFIKAYDSNNKWL